MTDDLTELPGRVQAELTRLRAERQLFTAEQDRLKARLAATEQELQDLTGASGELAARDARIAELTGRLEELTAERDRLRAEHDRVLARAEALEADVAGARAERDALRAELAGARAERDRLRLRLLDAELALAAGTEDEGEPAEPSTVDTQRAVVAERRAGELARELAATHETLSWRVTRPLRAVRRRIPRP